MFVARFFYSLRTPINRPLKLNDAEPRFDQSEGQKQ